MSFSSGMVPLKELGEIVSGSTPSTQVQEYWGGDIPWITPVDLTDHEGVYFTGKLRTITKAGYDSCSTKMLPSGTILFSSRAPIGHCAVATYPLCTNQGFKSIVPRECLDPVYGFFALKRFTPEIVALGRGATFAEINKELFGDFEIPLPPLPEQQRIAGILSRADRLRRLRRYALEMSESYLQGVFLEMFGGYLQSSQSSTEMGNLVEITGGGTPSREVARFYTGKIPWLTSKDMRGDYIWDSQEHITQEAIEQSATKLVPAKSILVVVKSKILMHRLPLAITMRPVCHGQDIKSIQCSDKLEPRFLIYVLKHNEGRLLTQARGANTEGLNLPMLREVPVPDISLSQQKRFVQVVDRFERVRAQQREALRQAENLFQTLLHRAFRGEAGERRTFPNAIL